MKTKSSLKFVAVLNKQVDLGKLYNALSHMSVGISHLLGSDKDVLFHNYQDKDGGVHPSISDHPFIVLKATNSSQIRSLREKIMEQHILYTDFVETMSIGTSEEQLMATKSKTEKELTYYGICFFGSEEVLNPLTKKFSLFKPDDNKEELFKLHQEVEFLKKLTSDHIIKETMLQEEIIKLKSIIEQKSVLNEPDHLIKSTIEQKSVLNEPDHLIKSTVEQKSVLNELDNFSTVTVLEQKEEISIAGGNNVENESD